MSEPARLHQRLPDGDSADPDDVLERFLDWLAARGLDPYPEQEEAILELLADRHVVLSTPTGSGKSLVAMALHFKGLCEGRRSFYTAPVKALVSEKFFELCLELGPERVGMLTGDASVNHDAPVICCTTEVLANMALRGGEGIDAPYAVLDEFHFYADRGRGVSWQIPLIALRHTLFLMMSATLGNTARIEERLRDFTGRDVAHVHSDLRPVPLDFEYRETPLHETLEELHAGGRSPVYVVNFTQRECGELAQGMTSARFCDAEERRRIAGVLADVHFDTAYGRDVKRFLSHGIGIHHAGLLPKYRLLVERLAQQGLLKVIFGTDTLGVGVNIPIRTVVFTKLSKFDGEKVGILSVRDFRQISGRAGRKGFDDRGSVVCQAPEHVIENRKLDARASAGGKRKPRKSAPRGYVPWNRDTFERLVERPAEPLESRFHLSHGMLLALLQRDGAGDYAAAIRLIDRSHESDAAKARERRHAAALFRSLRSAGIVQLSESGFGPPEVRVALDLQRDFSLHQTLSLYLVEAVEALDRESDSYALELLSLVEAIQEDPRPILAEQTWKLRRALMAELKAQGVDYDDRQRKLEEVSYERPEEAFLKETFALFAARHPWAGAEDVRPKSIAREMFEGYCGFDDYVKEYGLARCEGLLLRYLSQVHNTLVKSIPDERKTDEVYDVIAFLRTLLRVDASLVDAWEALQGSGEPDGTDAQAPRAFDLAAQPRALLARVRSEMLTLVRALAARDFDAATALLRVDPDQDWRPAALAASLAPYFEEYGEILFTPEARRAHHARMSPSGHRRWDVSQVLVDPAGDNMWALHGVVDLSHEREPEGPLFGLLRIGP